jgi:hypothetical protein
MREHIHLLQPIIHTTYEENNNKKLLKVSKIIEDKIFPMI